MWLHMKRTKRMLEGSWKKPLCTPKGGQGQKVWKNFRKSTRVLPKSREVV
jgi:hypothetical protein